jgi:hypothetical protein
MDMSLDAQTTSLNPAKLPIPHENHHDNTAQDLPLEAATQQLNVSSTAYTASCSTWQQPAQAALCQPILSCEGPNASDTDVKCLDPAPATLPTSSFERACPSSTATLVCSPPSGKLRLPPCCVPDTTAALSSHSATLSVPNTRNNGHPVTLAHLPKDCQISAKVPDHLVPRPAPSMAHILRASISDPGKLPSENVPSIPTDAVLLSLPTDCTCRAADRTQEPFSTMQQPPQRPSSNTPPQQVQRFDPATRSTRDSHMGDSKARGHCSTGRLSRKKLSQSNSAPMDPATGFGSPVEFGQPFPHAYRAPENDLTACHLVASGSVTDTQSPAATPCSTKIKSLDTRSVHVLSGPFLLAKETSDEHEATHAASSPPIWNGPVQQLNHGAATIALAQIETAKMDLAGEQTDGQRADCTPLDAPAEGVAALDASSCRPKRASLQNDANRIIGRCSDNWSEQGPQSACPTVPPQSSTPGSPKGSSTSRCSQGQVQGTPVLMSSEVQPQNDSVRGQTAAPGQMAGGQGTPLDVHPHRSSLVSSLLSLDRARCSFFLQGQAVQHNTFNISTATTKAGTCSGANPTADANGGLCSTTVGSIPGKDNGHHKRNIDGMHFPRETDPSTACADVSLVWQTTRKLEAGNVKTPLVSPQAGLRELEASKWLPSPCNLSQACLNKTYASDMSACEHNIPRCTLTPRLVLGGLPVVDAQTTKGTLQYHSHGHFPNMDDGQHDLQQATDVPSAVHAFSYVQDTQGAAASGRALAASYSENNYSCRLQVTCTHGGKEARMDEAVGALPGESEDGKGDRQDDNYGHQQRNADYVCIAADAGEYGGGDWEDGEDKNGQEINQSAWAAAQPQIGCMGAIEDTISAASLSGRGLNEYGADAWEEIPPGFEAGNGENYDRCRDGDENWQRKCSWGSAVGLNDEWHRHNGRCYGTVLEGVSRTGSRGDGQANWQSASQHHDGNAELDGNHNPHRQPQLACSAVPKEGRTAHSLLREGTCAQNAVQGEAAPFRGGCDEGIVGGNLHAWEWRHREKPSAGGAPGYAPTVGDSAQAMTSGATGPAKAMTSANGYRFGLPGGFCTQFCAPARTTQGSSGQDRELGGDDRMAHTRLAQMQAADRQTAQMRAEGCMIDVRSEAHGGLPSGRALDFHQACNSALQAGSNAATPGQFHAPTSSNMRDPGPLRSAGAQTTAPLWQQSAQVRETFCAARLAIVRTRLPCLAILHKH